MNTARAAYAWGVAVAGLLVCAGTCGPVERTRCLADADCGGTTTEWLRCDVPTGACLCTDDRACDPQERCNPAGRCQARAGCLDNADCPAATFCDVSTGQCVAQDVCGADQTCCTLDSHCGFGSICDALSFACVPGCRDQADCLPGQGCLGAGFGRLGQCSTACTADSLCPAGNLCNLADGRCTLDTRGPYCAGCSGGAESDDCGAPGNYCLLDTVNDSSYCGVDCHRGQACPSGYACADVIILPRSTLPTCTLPEACDQGLCARTGVSCAVDEDCPEGPPGSDCPRADVGNCALDALTPCTDDLDCPELGACLKQECRAREGAVFGVCSCTKDTDCPRDRCMDPDLSDTANPVAGRCELSGHPCYEDADCDVITCVGGGCLLGRNCKPQSGRTCADLLE